jgi:hypothetical protein
MLDFVAAQDLQTAWTQMTEAGTEAGPEAATEASEAGPGAGPEAATLLAWQPALEEEEVACTAWQHRKYHAESSSRILLVPPAQLS